MGVPRWLHVVQWAGSDIAVEGATFSIHHAYVCMKSGYDSASEVGRNLGKLIHDTNLALASKR
jgi:hypothetical protein